MNKSIATMLLALWVIVGCNTADKQPQPEPKVQPPTHITKQPPPKVVLPSDSKVDAGKPDMAVASEAKALPRREYERHKGFGQRRPRPDPKPRPPFNTETYDRIYENEFLAVKDRPLSTFSVDVDTASYSNVRRFLMSGKLPPKDAVRIEELINYFPYAYPSTSATEPFGISTETAAAPWNAKHRLLRIGIAGRNVAADSMPPRNLTFLLDVSGSMESPNKLPLLRRSLKLLVNQLNAKDRVAMVVYAGASGVVLPPTAGNRRNEITAALDKLSAGGPTNGADGIRQAYDLARRSFVKGGINRVILATDGDFNVGTTSQGELIRLIEKERESGVFLTVLGFGMGNYKDSTMEKLANKGNGNYAYIDNFAEARKVLVTQAGSTLVTIAKDVKLQIEFNPKLVKSYRLIGYENRMLKDEDFNDDKKDAGEVGAGHTVTALYEVVLNDGADGTNRIDPLRYQNNRPLSPAAASGELCTVKVRYKAPDGNKSKLTQAVVRDSGLDIAKSSGDLQFAASVAAFGMLLRDSQHRGTSNFDLVRQLAEKGRGKDSEGYRSEFLRLIEVARGLSGS